jgi:hypothetical protein
MKTADLKAGEIYAVRRARYDHPCLLLSTDVYREQRFSWSNKPDDYQIAPAGTKPSASKSFASPTCYGFITLNGDADMLAGLDVAATLGAILAGGSAGRPEGTSIKFVTSPAAFLGRFEEHQAAERERLNAEQASRNREKERRQAVAHRHNTVVDRFNAALREDLIAQVADDGYSEPTGVKLTLAQAEALADLLDAIRADSEA